MALKLDNHPSMQVTVIPILLEVSNQGELQDNVFVFTGKISYCSGVAAICMPDAITSEMS